MTTKKKQGALRAAAPRMRGAVSKERKHLAWLKWDRRHTAACSVKAFGGGPATWADADKGVCTCYLGKQIAESRARLAEMRAAPSGKPSEKKP